MKKYGNEKENRPGDFWIVERPLMYRNKFVLREDCIVPGVMEIGKSKRYVGTHSALQKHSLNFIKLRKLWGVHEANEGKRSTGNGAKLKKEGMEPGMPDLLVFDGYGGFNGLAIELKTKGDRVKDEQYRCSQELAAR